MEEPEQSEPEVLKEPVDVAVERIARSQHGAFSRQQALDCGATDSLIHRRKAARRWRRVAPSVYVLAGWERTFRQRVVVATLQIPGSAASHECAALLRKLDGVRTARIEITVPRTCGAKPKGVTLHRSDDLLDEDVEVVDGIRTTTATRTLVDLAAQISRNDLECAYECGVRRGETSLEAIEALVERVGRSGRRGVAGARALIKIAVQDGKRNGSELETRFFQILRELGLPLPTRQHQVFRPDGRFAYADYAYDDEKVVFELQGYEGHSTKKQHRRDTERNNMIALRGYTLYEFTWHHVMREPDMVKRVVLEALGVLTFEYRK